MLCHNVLAIFARYIFVPTPAAAVIPFYFSTVCITFEFSAWKDCPEENKVILGSNEDLFKTDLIADDFNWIEELAEDEVVKARIRYHQAEKEATAKKNPDGTVAIHFLEPQRAITKGQAVVLYRGKHVVGGGTIKNTNL